MALATNLLWASNLDGNSNDAVGSNNGTDTNISYVTSSSGLGQAADFNGTSSKIVFAAMGNAAGDNISWGCRVKFDTLGSDRAIMSNEDTGSGWGFLLRYENADQKLHALVATTSPGGSINVASAQTVTTGVWYDVEVIWTQGTGLTIVVNSRSNTQGSANTTLRSPGNNVILGMFSGGSWLDGQIDVPFFHNRAITYDEALQIANNGKGNALPFTDTPPLYGCTTYYKLENTTDELGQYTLTGTGSPGSAAGIIGNGRTYVGGTSRDAFSKTDAASQGTFTFWFKYSSINASFGRVLSKTQSGVTDAFIFAVDSSNVPVLYINDSVNLNGSDSAVSTNTLYHYVVTWDGSNVKTYRNGTLVTNTVSTKTLQANGQPFYIGGTDVNTQGITGLVDELGFFPRPVSATEASYLYASAAGNQYPFTIPSANTFDAMSVCAF